MIFLFIGGNSDGQEIEVPAHMTAFRVADKIESSLSLESPLSKEPIKSSLYTKRTIRRWSLSGGFWATDDYFAAQDLSDEEATKRFVECTQ